MFNKYLVKFVILSFIVALGLILLPVRHIARATDFTVTNTNDSGLGSLRQAIIDANSTPGPDTIEFAISGCSGVCKIQPTSPLPALNGGGTTIDGYTQSGATEATATTPATLNIEIDGSSIVVVGSSGFSITSANNVIKGLVINNFPFHGVSIYGSSAANNIVAGNHIGTNAGGTAAMSNVDSGIHIYAGAQNNTVGGNEARERNVISGNDDFGVGISGVTTISNTVSGNYIGTTANGTAPLGNSYSGVIIYAGAQNNTVGGNTPGERNIISGNWVGIYIEGNDTMGNIVSGNYIGTAVNGTTVLSNTSKGVLISFGAHNNTIGGDTEGKRNVISGNDGDGVYISGSGTMSNSVSGNYIGLAANGVTPLGNPSGVIIMDGAQNNTIGPDNVIAHNGWDGVGVFGGSTTGNTITQNSIFSNTMGIYLTSGANGDIATPVIVTTTTGSVNIIGTACSNCTVEVFQNSDDDGEGEDYKGKATADASGAFTVAVTSLNRPYLTATATDVISGTSEFSAVFTTTVPLAPDTGPVYLPIIMRNN